MMPRQTAAYPMNGSARAFHTSPASAAVMAEVIIRLAMGDAVKDHDGHDEAGGAAQQQPEAARMKDRFVFHIPSLATCPGGDNG